MPLLNLVNVSKTYHLNHLAVPVLKNINFQAEAGEYIAIMGPSGSGKSTLMHLIGCLDTPTSGQIFLNQKDISRLTEKELALVRSKEIGFVFQAYNLIPRLPAVDNVALPLFYTGVPPEERQQKALAALKKVGLEKRAHHASNQLSGGEQQRVAIARALINQPKIILADEPTGNLDTKGGAEIMDIFTELNHKGHTVIVVTHEEETAAYTKRIIHLRDGVIIKS